MLKRTRRSNLILTISVIEDIKWNTYLASFTIGTLSINRIPTRIDRHNYPERLD